MTGYGLVLCGIAFPASFGADCTLWFSQKPSQFFFRTKAPTLHFRVKPSQFGTMRNETSPFGDLSATRSAPKSHRTRFLTGATNCALQNRPSTSRNTGFREVQFRLTNRHSASSSRLFYSQPMSLPQQPIRKPNRRDGGSVAHSVAIAAKIRPLFFFFFSPFAPPSSKVM